MVKKSYKWQMVVDTDRCIGCQACVVACQVENNVPLNAEGIFNQKRAMQWIRIERYWEGIDEAKESGDVTKVPAQTFVGEFIATFKEYPQRQKSAKFNVDDVLQKLHAPAAGN